MRKQKKKKSRLKTRIPHQSTEQRIINVKPEDLAKYVHQAEQQALPVIKEAELSAGAALFLLAQYAQVLISGNPRFTVESATTITDNVLSLWQTGFYHPSVEYPFTLEETLQDLKEGLNTKADYSKYFQSFTPSNTNTPVGIGRVGGGIVQHPKTLLWQIWMIMEGPCVFIGAYRDPATAQRNLERIVYISRYGYTNVATYEDVADGAHHLYQELISQGDGESMQLPYDMIAYLIDHLHLYMIEL